MPTYMDIHVVPGATAKDVAEAHYKDVEAQKKHGVEYVKYWFNDSCGKIFCLVNAPSAEAAAHVHNEAHGLIAEKIIEVQPEIARGSWAGSSRTRRVRRSSPAVTTTTAIPGSGPSSSPTSSARRA
jgi:hypothetical protein